MVIQEIKCFLMTSVWDSMESEPSQHTALLSHVWFHLGHIAWRPPSMGRLTPVMKLAASDARKAMLCATSSTSPGRPRACVCWHLSRNWRWRRLTEWALNTLDAVKSVADPCCLAEGLRCRYAPTKLNFDHEWWITSMGIILKWH